MTEADFAINLDEDEYDEGEHAGCPSGQSPDQLSNAKRPRDAVTGREPQPKRKNK